MSFVGYYAYNVTANGNKNISTGKSGNNINVRAYSILSGFIPGSGESAVSFIPSYQQGGIRQNDGAGGQLFLSDKNHPNVTQVDASCLVANATAKSNVRCGRSFLCPTCFGFTGRQVW